MVTEGLPPDRSEGLRPPAIRNDTIEQLGRRDLLTTDRFHLGLRACGAVEQALTVLVHVTAAM
jgi:hypothetical protein